MSSPRILLVEDDDNNIELTMSALALGGVEEAVAVARDGREALKMLFEKDPRLQRDQLRVILLDLRMPVMDGFETLRRLRHDERTRHMPVVVLTSSDRPEDVAEAYRLGASSYVCKPVAFDAFSKAVTGVVAYWLGLNRVPQMS